MYTIAFKTTYSIVYEIVFELQRLSELYQKV
jgi:hypothetical protein